jgi:hypothetical protein
MLETKARFKFDSRWGLTQWYGHVQLLPEHVLGQWFCIDRSTGRVLWERRMGRADTVCGVSQGVIVASETRSDGPWTADFGCYGISLESGQRLWTSHADGAWGHVLALLDRVPGFTNELRDVPTRVEGGECVCRSGRVLDVKTGKQVRRISREEAAFKSAAPTDAEVLYEGRMRVRLGANRWLSRRAFKDEEIGGMHLKLHVVDDDWKEVWKFSPGENGYYSGESNFFSYRYQQGYVYMVVTDAKVNQTPLPGGDMERVNFRVVTLDVGTGKIVQDVPIGDRAYAHCRIEDVDDTGMLVSAEGKCLWYFARNA